MKALRLILFGVVLALFVLFSFSNWVRVPVVLPDGTTVSVFLPIVVIVAFVLGWLPTLLLHVASRASWRRRAARTDRLLEDALSTGTRVVPAAGPLPVGAHVQPTVFPPPGI